MRAFTTVFAVIGIGLAGCTAARERRQAADSRVYSRETMRPPAPPGLPTALRATMQEAVPGATDLPTVRLTPESPSMVIRTGQAAIEVDSLEPAVARVRLLAGRVRGYVANTTLQAGQAELRTASLEVKMPVDRFDDAVAALGAIGKLESVTVSAEEVSEEFTDVTARITNARRLEARLIDLLATRVGRLKDVLDVERELARVREEIERYEGRLRYLRAHAELSTLTVTVHEPIPVVGRAGSSVIGEAFKQAWRNFVGLVAACIRLLGVAVPLAVLASGAWFGFKRYRSAVAARAGARG
jgi:uncharacterized protein DUF4349